MGNFEMLKIGVVQILPGIFSWCSWVGRLEVSFNEHMLLFYFDVFICTAGRWRSETTDERRMFARSELQISALFLYEFSCDRVRRRLLLCNKMTVSVLVSFLVFSVMTWSECGRGTATVVTSTARTFLTRGTLWPPAMILDSSNCSTSRAERNT